MGKTGWLFLVMAMAAGARGADPPKAPLSWTFVVSGDSRNCGDMIMPVIAQRSAALGAKFYWHLGDLRALYGPDEDYTGLHRKEPAALTKDAYLKAAWGDFEQNQVAAFNGTPFFLGIGNHETIGRTPEQFVEQFKKLLDMEPIRRQREADDPNDHTVRSYYHWKEGGVDFINMDNANSVFDDAQLAWAIKVLGADEADPAVKIVIVGMHESLPDSYSRDHSMNQGRDKGASGKTLYKRLIELRAKTGKPVHVFSSHSHYFLTDVYNTGAWQFSDGVLPGWLIGTAGAQHYSVPPEVKSFATWAENQYGYAVVRVTPGTGSVTVRFVAIGRQELVPGTIAKFGQEAVNFCFTKNWRATLHEDPY